MTTSTVQDRPTGGGAKAPRSLKQPAGAIAGVAVALAIALLPSISGLDATGQRALAVIALAVVFWATDVLNVGITAVLAIGLLVALGVPSSVALGGFGSGAFWILVSVLFFGTAMDRTGLARRISYRILLVFHGSYAGILFAFMLIGFVLAVGIPSMTVRTAIMVPIAFALVQAMRLPLPGAGAALIVLSAFEMAVLPGCALLTGSLWGPFIVGLYNTAHVPLAWLEWAKVMAPPTVVWCGLLLAANYLAMRPSGPVMSGTMIRVEMAKLGRVSRAEAMTAAIVGLSIVAWASQPWHRVPAEAIGMIALALLFATKVLSPVDIGTGISWGLAIFIGGMLSITAVMTAVKVNAWLGTLIVPGVGPYAGNLFLFTTAIAIAVAVMRFIDPIGFITIAAFFLPLVGFGGERGITPLVLTGIILLPIHVFWLNYQNIWVTMTEGISKRSAYTDGQRMTLATVFLVATIVSLWLAVLYWRLIGAV